MGSVASGVTTDFDVCVFSVFDKGSSLGFSRGINMSMIDEVGGVGLVVAEADGTVSLCF